MVERGCLEKLRALYFVVTSHHDSFTSTKVHNGITSRALVETPIIVARLTLMVFSDAKKPST